MPECSRKEIHGREYYCTVELTLNVIGGKWKPIILYHLGNEGTKRFGELKQMMPNITQKMLTQQLRELEHDGLVHRKVFAEVPPKVEYSLTDFGRTIMPVMQNLCRWGQSYEDKFRPAPAAGEVERVQPAIICQECVLRDIQPEGGNP